MSDSSEAGSYTSSELQPRDRGQECGEISGKGTGVELEAEPGMSKSRLLSKSKESKVFDNVVIMTRIAEHLDPKDLLALRATNKLWSATILPELRQNHPDLKLSFNNSLTPPNVTLHGFNVPNPTAWQAQRKLQALVDSMAKSSDIPFGRYHIKGVSLNSRCVWSLFEISGAFMTSLKITLKDVSVEEFSIRDFRDVFKYTPLLEELEIVDLRSKPLACWNEERLYESSDGAEFPLTFTIPALKAVTIESQTLRHASAQQFLNDFFNAAVNLEHIDISHTKVVEDPFPNTNMTVINALAQRPSLKSFQILQLRNLTATELGSLIALSERQTGEAKLVLKEFSIQYARSHRRAEILTPAVSGLLIRFLELQKEHLILLDIEFTSTGPVAAPAEPNVDERVVLNVPKFRKLDTLALKLPHKSRADDGFQVRFDSLPGSFPKLKFLILNTGGDQLWRESDTINIDTGAIAPLPPPHPGVEILYLHLVGRDHSWVHLHHAFPNVVELCFRIERLEDIREVFRIWNKLRILNVYFLGPCQPHRVDEILTGIPTQPFLQLKASEVPQEKWRDFKVQPGITDLQDLRQFSLHSAQRPNTPKPAYIRDETFFSIGAYFGFEIDVSRSSSTMLTRIGIQHTYTAGPDPESKSKAVLQAKASARSSFEYSEFRDEKFCD